MKIKDRIFNYFTPELVEDKRDFRGTFTIVPQAPSRTTRDIYDFITALKSAESHIMQERTVLYTIFQENLDYDAHMQGVIERRIDNIVNKDIGFMVGEKEREDIAEWAQSPWFRDFLADLVMVRFWGMGLFEFKKGDTFDYFQVPIRHINPYSKEVLKRQQEGKGESYAKRKDVFFAGDKSDFGYFKTLAPLCIHKRNLMNFWSTYAELAGNNFMQVNYRVMDPSKKDDLQRAIHALKAGQAFMKPDGVDIEVTNLASSQQNALFENYYKALTQEQSKFILGQTMTTTEGSSRSQAEVHERTQAEIFASDDKYILDILNYTFVQYHGLWNLPDGKWVFKEDSSVKMMAEIEKDMKLKALGYNFTQEFIAEKYGLPVQEEPKKEEDADTRVKKKAVPDKDGLDGDNVE